MADDSEEFEPGIWARHAPAPGTPPEALRRGGTHPVTRALTALVVALALAQVLAIAALWPRGPAPSPPASTDAYAGVSFAEAVITGTLHKACPGAAIDRLPDGTIPASVTCVDITVKLSGGPAAGTVATVGLPPQVAKSGVAVGTHVQLALYPGADGSAPVYAFVDFSRERPLLLLAAAFVVLVLIVARLRGLAAIVGLLAAFAMVGVFVIPALRRGENPVLVGALSAGAIMTAILYLAHGFSTKTTTALLGTLAGIWVTAGLAAWVSASAHLNGLGTEENATLSTLTTGRDLSGIIVCGIILAGLGVLNDVTITQSSAVWELHDQAPTLTPLRLFTSGMRIGRDHLASTVYTIAFAYAGVALPALILINVYGQPLRQLLSSSQIGEEIARTLVASIGLVLAIPLTTAIAAVTAGSRTTAPPLGTGADPEVRPRGRRAHR